MDWLDEALKICRTYHLLAVGIGGLIMSAVVGLFFYRPWGETVNRRETQRLDRRGRRLNRTTEGVCRGCLGVHPLHELYVEDDGSHICGVCRARGGTDPEKDPARPTDAPCRKCQHIHRVAAMYKLQDEGYICAPCREEVLAARAKNSPAGPGC